MSSNGPTRTETKKEKAAALHTQFEIIYSAIHNESVRQAASELLLGLSQDHRDLYYQYVTRRNSAVCIKGSDHNGTAPLIRRVNPYDLNDIEAATEPTLIGNDETADQESKKEIKFKQI